MTDRPAIPAEIRRRVLVEAGHRCAIPTCRDLMIEVHHIVPWSECQAHEYDNLIALCPTCHAMATKGKIDRKAMKLYKFNLRFAHDKFSQIEMDMLFALGSMNQASGSELGTLWPSYNAIMLKRVIDVGYLTATKIQNGQSFTFGMETTPVMIRLTQAGKDFLNQMGLVEF